MVELDECFEVKLYHVVDLDQCFGVELYHVVDLDQCFLCLEIIDVVLPCGIARL